MACVLVGGRAAFEEAGIKSDIFYIHKNRWVWQVCEKLYADGLEIDMPTVIDKLERAGHLEDCGGRFWLNGLVAGYVSGLYLSSNVRILLDYAARRRKEAELQAATNENGKAIARLHDLSIPLPEDPRLPRIITEWNAAEILTAEFPDPTGPLPGIILTGANILGGRPKKGKSLFVEAFAAASSMGGRFMGREVKRARVLLYALEDRPKILQMRLQKWGLTPDASLTIRRQIPPLHLGGLAEIERAYSDGYELIALDTITRAMPGLDLVKDARIFDEILSKMREMALRAEAADLVVMHIRKPNGMSQFSPVDDILGGTGLTAAADSVIGLYTEHGKAGARLIGELREAEPFDLKMHIDPETLCWQLDGDTDEIRLSDDEDEILDVLPGRGWMKVATIAKEIRKDRANTSRRCASLWVKGKIKRDDIEGVTHYCAIEDKATIEVHTQPTYTTQDTQGTQDTLPV